MDKVIMCKYREDGEDWHEVTLERAKSRLSGYWKEESIETMLMDEGLTLYTPFADYKAVYKDV